jgi:threonylcarbamoyladenosine tRNA methylthiotransferase MtaB
MWREKAKLGVAVRFRIYSFGCRASQADGAALETALRAGGGQAVNDHPDLVVVNTCTVTALADGDARKLIRRIHREHPGAQIVVTGCYAQRAPQELLALPGVSLVVGNSDRGRLPDLLLSGAPFHGEVYVSDIFQAREFGPVMAVEAIGERSRPNLKIQDGCNNRCSFCVIPQVRGRSRSAPAWDVVERVRELSTRYAEIVLTGINLGRWGREPGSAMRLADLLRLLLAETDVQRLRLSSVEPMDWSDDLLRLMADSPRIARHVHAPLQSGSDPVLRRMRRRYRSRHYVERILRAREWMPDAAIGADVMAGFPGETEEEFQATVELVEQLPFTYLHVFPYSERPGTPAAEMPQLPVELRRERGRILEAIGARKNLAFRESLQGRSLSVVTLDELGHALSSNYVRVELASPRPARQILDIVAGEVTARGVREATPFAILTSPSGSPAIC